MNTAPSPAPSAARGMTVGVYDEPELVVSGISGMLAKQGLRSDVLPLIAGSTGARIDVLLCDPVGRPVEIEQYLAEIASFTSAPVLVFTWSNSPLAVDSAALVEALQAVSRGQSVSPSTSRPRKVPGTTELSTRESEVLELICRGLSNLEIAEKLYVSVNSVKTYVRQIYQKIGVTRRAQAVAWGLAHGY